MIDRTGFVAKAWKLKCTISAPLANRTDKIMAIFKQMSNIAPSTMFDPSLYNVHGPVSEIFDF